MFQPSESGADAPKVPPAQNSKKEPRQERLRHVLYGSLAGIDRTIKILHVLGYADPNDWSKPMPTEKPNRWMVIMTKILLIK
ncbi:MAG TPA: hypothetical protein V6D29_24965 [Leptolyngbyaceae cyanobacterium]